MTSTSASEYLTERQFCDRYNIAPRTAQRWRANGEGPPWVRKGPRLIAYRLADCENWASARTFVDRAQELSATAR